MTTENQKETTEQRGGLSVENALLDADSKSKYELVADLINCIPTNWCDPLLTGDSKVLINKPGQWDCTDIERLLLALRKRLEEKAGI